MDKNKTIIVTVNGGVAEIYHNPTDIEVIVVDYDNLEDVDGYVYCPACSEYFEPFPLNGICTVCGFDVNSLDKNIE